MCTPEHAVKVALVFVSHGADDLFHPERSRPQQRLRRRHPLRPQQFLKGLSEHRSDPPRKVRLRVAERPRQFLQRCGGVALFEVPQNGASECGVRRGNAQRVHERIAVVCKVGKEEGNESAVYFVRAVDDRIDEVVHQIADGKGILCAEKEVFRFSRVVEVVRQEPAHHGIVVYLRKDCLQKRIGEDKVDADILPARPSDGVARMPVEEEDVAPFERDGLFADDVRNAPRIHVHEFHVVVSVLREVDKPRMRTEVEFPLAEQFSAVYDESVRIGVIVLFYVAPPQDLPFLVGQARQTLQNCAVHTASIAYPAKKVK